MTCLVYGFNKASRKGSIGLAESVRFVGLCAGACADDLVNVAVLQSEHIPIHRSGESDQFTTLEAVHVEEGIRVEFQPFIVPCTGSGIDWGPVQSAGLCGVLIRATNQEPVVI